MITDSLIESGSDQCDAVVGEAATACCYVPPSQPCNICQDGSEFDDVMSNKSVEYGGTETTCGTIFNALFTREEKDSGICSLVSEDLSSQCCYNKCSLCGNLQTNSAATVNHEGVDIGCSEFDSYIFASNFIIEASNECRAVQDDHRSACCYDTPCALCSQGDTLYQTKEADTVSYGGTESTCGDVANFLYQEMGQSNTCLVAQAELFDSCCFKQCEMCDSGESVNWAASSDFNGSFQSCTDIYWLLVSESVESNSNTCSAAQDAASNACCYERPTEQCSLCRDESGTTYNTRWNLDVTVDGLTRTCGDFNTLLSTQEKGSPTCSMAKDEIFNQCCFAGSDALLASALEATSQTDSACNLCEAGQIGINAPVNFNDSETSCAEVYNFLVTAYKDGSSTCSATKADLSSSCCRDTLAPGESAAFGTFGDIDIPEGKAADVPAEYSAPRITPPKIDLDWNVERGSMGSAKSSGLLASVVGFLSFSLFCYL